MRGQDSFRTFEEVLQVAQEQDADLVLLGGDLFHENKPSRATLVRTMDILARACLNDRPVQFQVLSDPATTVEGGYDMQTRILLVKSNVAALVFRRINFESPNHNIGLPVFTIHGNHDDPTGTSSLSAVNVLSTAMLVNYFGKAVRRCQKPTRATAPCTHKPPHSATRRHLVRSQRLPFARCYCVRGTPTWRFMAWATYATSGWGACLTCPAQSHGAWLLWGRSSGNAAVGTQQWGRSSHCRETENEEDSLSYTGLVQKRRMKLGRMIGLTFSCCTKTESRMLRVPRITSRSTVSRHGLTWSFGGMSTSAFHKNGCVFCFQNCTFAIHERPICFHMTAILKCVARHV